MRAKWSELILDFAMICNRQMFATSFIQLMYNTQGRLNMHRAQLSRRSRLLVQSALVSWRIMTQNLFLFYAIAAIDFHILVLMQLR